MEWIYNRYWNTETFKYSVAVLTVTVHFSFVLTFRYLKICCFLHWIQSVHPHFYVTLYYNGCPYIPQITVSGVKFDTIDKVNIDFKNPIKCQ